jgi:hypothetical protein
MEKHVERIDSGDQACSNEKIAAMDIVKELLEMRRKSRNRDE